MKNRITIPATAAGAAFAVATFLSREAYGAECMSVAGMLNGKRVSAVRTVKLSSSRITLGGTFEGKTAPPRTLPCKVIAKGVFCEAAFEGVVVTVMTNGKRMIEAVTDQSTRRELASMAYVCDRAMKP